MFQSFHNVSASIQLSIIEQKKNDSSIRKTFFIHFLTSNSYLFHEYKTLILFQILLFLQVYKMKYQALVLLLFQDFPDIKQTPRLFFLKRQLYSPHIQT
ncbi:hypothetical protein AB1278_06590 [Chryseobacterium sp. NRRL B-14798]|uniref:hypothetical protein n=1 Tax=Chryseobacterium sp. NRRL B-14798 TaxID=3162880 RepID=UPI003D1D349B